MQGLWGHFGDLISRCWSFDISAQTCVHSDKQYLRVLYPSLNTMISLRMLKGPNPGAPAYNFVSGRSTVLSTQVAACQHCLFEQRNHHHHQL